MSITTACVVTNITSYATLTKSSWRLDCDETCDEVIVRQIAFSPEEPHKGIFIIESSLNSDAIIGTILSEGCITNPQTTIQLKQPLGGHISFRLLTTDGRPANVLGDISISLDFVKHPPPRTKR